MYLLLSSYTNAALVIKRDNPTVTGQLLATCAQREHIGSLVKSEPAKILAFYKVYFNGDKNKWYSFEIRKDDAGNTILDHDDTLTEYLYQLKAELKEVNALTQRIFEAMGKDYFGSSESK